MGLVYADITLKNVGDVINVQRGILPEQEIRQTTVTAMVDTGAMTLIINESMRKQLGLTVRMEKEVRLANDEMELVKIADPVEVHWKDREMVCRPWVMPGEGEALLGAIPLEDMDLIVDPARQELVGAHGDKPLGVLVGIRE